MDSSGMPTAAYEELFEPLTSLSRATASPRDTGIDSTKQSSMYIPAAIEEEFFMGESEYTGFSGRTTELSEGIFELEYETEKSNRVHKKFSAHFHSHYDDLVKLHTDDRNLVMPTSLFEDFLNFFDDFSDSESIETYVQSDYETPPNFFEELGSVPDIDDMSKDDLMTFKKTKNKSGRFVDPLTGELVYEDPDQLEEREHFDNVECKEKTSDLLYEEYSFDNFDAMYPAEKSKLTIASEFDEGEIFTMVPPKHVEKLDFTPIPATNASVADIPTQTKRFLEELVAHVVNISENVERVKEFRNTLDKNLIFERIIEILVELKTDMSIRGFLTRKICEYYRRKGVLRYMIEEKQVRSHEEKEAYEKKLEELNSILGREVATKEINFKNIEKCTEQFQEMEKYTKETMEAFETMIKKTLHKDSMPNLMLIIKSELKHMSQLREQISEVRSEIIQKQHVLGTLKAKSERIENIGNGLSLGDYFHLSRTTKALDKKIEYRNKELNRAYRRFLYDLHVKTHTRVESDLLIRRVASKMNALQDYEDMEYMVRKQVHSLTKKRERIRRQLNDLNENCGLLDKPALLRDYDETMERLGIQRKKVDTLRTRKIDLEDRLRKAQQNPTLPKQKSVILKSKNLNSNLWL